MKKPVYFVLLTLLFACAQDETFHLRMQHANGLSPQSNILANGLVIGKVQKLSLDSAYRVIVDFELTDGLSDIPTDSKFILSTDMLGSASLEIKVGTEPEFFAATDTIDVEVARPEIGKPMDMIPSVLQRLFLDTSNDEKMDSILYELRRLNDNLEEGR